MELVGPGRERLDAAHWRGLAGTDQIALELPLVVDQVVLGEVVEVREGELVTVRDRDRRRGVVHGGGVRLMLGALGRLRNGRRGDDCRDARSECLSCPPAA